MKYKSIATIHRNGKDIVFFLKEGEVLSYENIVDVEVHNQPERSKREDTQFVFRKPDGTTEPVRFLKFKE